MPIIKEHVHRWNVWCAIFSVLPLLVKKDKDDAEGHLFALFAELQAHIRNAPIDAILRITNTITACDKLQYIFTNKVTRRRPHVPFHSLNRLFSFQFSISCIIVLILKIESVYAITSNAINAKQQVAWTTFLTALIDATSNTTTQIANVSFENDIVKPLVSHFSRFRELKAQPLIAVLTQNATASI